MRSFSVACLVVLGGLPFYAGLEFARPVQAHVADPAVSVSTHPADPCKGLREWGLFVEGETAGEWVAQNTGKVQRLIDLLDIQIGIPALTELLINIDKNPQKAYKVPEALQGIGGLSTTLLLQKLLLFKKDKEGNNVKDKDGNNIPSADKVLYGKIRDYTYDKKEERGHLSVDVCIDRKEFVKVNENRKEFYHWDIEIENGFRQMKRDEPSNPDVETTYNNPFPGFNLPKIAIDPADPRSIWRRGLDYKLYARGKGIKVRHIYYRRVSDPELERLPVGHQFYESTTASCVDLFTEGPPPGTFAELTDNGYCLGRCPHPPIINSGD